MSAFQRPARRTVDPAALERFATGADDRRAALGTATAVEPPVEATPPQSRPVPSPAPVAAPAVPAAATPATTSVPVQAPVVTTPAPSTSAAASAAEVGSRLSEQVLWRVTPETQQLFNFVFENTNVKSKQKLIDAIMLPELERRAAELRKG